jgi:anaerobic magnesium-protoporphyrin IX monomethyl ester cyclase
MTSVCLIIPPSPFLLDERVFMPLGVLKVASALESAGHPVEVLDLSGYSNFEEIAARVASQSKARHFGITATTPQFPAATKIADIVRAARPEAVLILGGPHPTLTAAAAKKEEKRGAIGRASRAMDSIRGTFDRIVTGDGEKAILVALHDDAPALIDADGRHSSLFMNDASLNATAWPARHLVDVPSYHYTIDGASSLSVIAQLGCPFSCGFCAGRNSPMLRHIRMRSAENIVNEMMHLRSTYGIKGVMFYDDELNVNKGVVDLMNRIAETADDWKLRGFVKSELFTDEQAHAMYRAGFRWLLVGFESGSPRILDNIRKRATRDDNTRCIQIARRHGLKVKALMSLGHPGESGQTVAETREWLLEERPEDFDVTIITPYPGSPYYDDAVETAPHVWTYSCPNGDSLHQAEVDYARDADYYKGDPDDGYVSHVWTPDLSAVELVHARGKLESDVREALNIPFNPAAAAQSYEHSMGMTALPPRLFKASEGHPLQ